MTRGALSRNPLTRGTSGNLCLTAAINTNFCLVDQALLYTGCTCSTAAEQGSRIDAHTDGRPGKAATKVCGSRAKLCS